MKRLQRGSLCEPLGDYGPRKAAPEQHGGFTYYQLLCVLIEDKLRIMKQVTNLYIKKVRFTTDIHKIYIKPCELKKINWYTDAYRMEPTDIEQIIKEQLDEWK